MTEYQELLGRDPVRVDPEALRPLIRGRAVLVTGGVGSIGSELCRQIAPLDPSALQILDQDETGLFRIEQELRSAFPRLHLVPILADATQAASIRSIFARCRPFLVFHAAAYKHVPIMEANPDEAVRNNVVGVAVVGRAAQEAGASRFVFISSDKAVEPTSILGKTKRIGELAVAELNRSGRTRFMSVRFGNVMGSRGSAVETFLEQIRAGGPVTITHPEMERYFMLASEAVLLILQAAAFGQGGETFILDMGRPIRILDLARGLMRRAGREVPIRVVGMRPGERLTEKLFFDDETPLTTQHPKIFVARGEAGGGSTLSQIDAYAAGRWPGSAVEFLDAVLAAPVRV
jgi:FlaA1/EpsC-like NDP-sugar epimerase